MKLAILAACVAATISGAAQETKCATPYTVSVPDKNGYVYFPSNTADYLMRLDPRTGEVTEYLMPTRDFNTRELAIDPITRHAVWTANTRNARLIRVEPPE